MIDISKQSVKIDCPECKRSISVTIKQVAHEALVKSNKAYTPPHETNSTSWFYLISIL